ncbi:hypothetical protein [Nocardia wallacei]|uniref:hypothetical protein n=1 Tax=Nocardia wallacei TaxID=480035 RepID=UPI0024560163|nr:hypothetical protein [Nocardia wallacei]
MSGIGMPESTRPTRAQRRQEASRVHADRARTPGEEEDAPAPQEEHDRGDTRAETPAPHEKEKPMPVRPTVTLPVKKRPAKRPFATQIRPSTAARLEWARRQHGAALTDVVDDAINAYLDAAGIPPADEHGNVGDPT